MSGCFDTGRPGCRGMLCRSAHASLRRLPVRRYPHDDCGQPDLSAQPLEGWVCALVSFSRRETGGRLSVPGITGGQQPMHITAAAGSFEVPLATGDRMTVDGRQMRVSAVSTGRLITALLEPEEDSSWV